MTMAMNDPDDDLIPLAPLDEDEEQRRREAMENDLRSNHDLLEAMTRRPSVPLEHRENLITTDLEHFVINYCLDSYDGHSQRAYTHAIQLRRFGALGKQTAQEFIDGKKDPALKHIPSDRLAKLFQTLLDELRGG